MKTDQVLRKSFRGKYPLCRGKNHLNGVYKTIWGEARAKFSALSFDF